MGNVLLPVVQSLTNPVVVGFIGFYITSSTGGSTKDITGYFTGYFYAGDTTGGGGSYGVYSPPQLVQ